MFANILNMVRVNCNALQQRWNPLTWKHFQGKTFCRKLKRKQNRSGNFLHCFRLIFHAFIISSCIELMLMHKTWASMVLVWLGENCVGEFTFILLKRENLVFFPTFLISLQHFSFKLFFDNTSIQSLITKTAI